MAYHGGQEAGSVSVGNGVKGGGISERLVAGEEEEEMPGLSGTASAISNTSDQAVRREKNMLVLAEEPRSKRGQGINR